MTIHKLQFPPPAGQDESTQNSPAEGSPEQIGESVKNIGKVLIAATYAYAIIKGVEYAVLYDSIVVSIAVVIVGASLVLVPPAVIIMTKKSRIASILMLIYYLLSALGFLAVASEPFGHFDAVGFLYVSCGAFLTLMASIQTWRFHAATKASTPLDT